MKNKRLILQGVLIIILFGMVVLGISLAWFTMSKDVEMNDITIDVGSSDTFEISLDGVNFTRKLDINLLKASDLDDGSITYSDIQLVDVGAVYEENTSKSGTKYYGLKICDPIRQDYNGNPKIYLDAGEKWPEAKKTKILSSGGKYFLVSDDPNSVAQYIELDMWIRSDSDLEIFASADSSISTIDTTTEAGVVPAMYAIKESLNPLTITDYSLNAGKYCALIDYDGYTYYYSYQGDTRTFIIKFKEDGNYIDYYDKDGLLIAKAKDSGDYIDLYDENFNFLFKVLKSRIGSNGVLFYHNDENNTIFNILEYSKIDKKYSPLKQYFARTDYNSINTKTVDNDNSQLPLSNIKYYDANGELLCYRKYNPDGSFNDYSDENAQHLISEHKNYQVLVPSSYGSNENIVLENTEGLIIKSNREFIFSKNLVSGATLVSFSELITDEFDEGHKEVEDLKYVWKPNCNYKLTSVENGLNSTFEYIANGDNKVNYYSFPYGSNTYYYHYVSGDELTPVFPLKTGALLTTEKEVSTGEIPICSTHVPVGETYCVKKVRIKIWIDGDNSLASNSMFNASSVGHGSIKVSLKLVANVNRTVVKMVNNLGNGVFQMAAEKVNGKTETYTWSVDGQWKTADQRFTFAIATIDQNGLLQFNQNGTVVVYAKDSQGRVGALPVTYNFGIISIAERYGDDLNCYKLVVKDDLGGSLTFEPIWRLSSDKNARLSKENGETILTFTDSDEVIVYCEKRVVVGEGDLQYAYVSQIQLKIVYVKPSPAEPVTPGGGETE